MSELPRLAVVSDVVPCRSQGGELLLYRLLRDYPADRLAVVHGGRSPYFDTDKLLPGVQYSSFNPEFALPRPLRTRWFPFWRAMELSLAARYAGRVAEMLDTFRPDVVLTVTDNTLWVAAAAAARRLKRPLTLIQHDDVACKTTGNSPKLHHRLTQRLIDRVVGRVYRQAAVRFCVSPGMAELYRAKFGADAEVLYPSRGDDSPEPRVRVNPALAGKPPVVAFAGALYTEGAREMLRRMADVLAPLGGRLDLYTRPDPDALKQFRLDRENVRVVGFLPPHEMADRMAETAHLLFLPASFLPSEATDVSTLFPSKLADYTAVGLPILVWGPAYSSAVCWLKENPTAGVPHFDLDPSPVRDSVVRLSRDTGQATSFATAALKASGNYFSAEPTRRMFYATLAGGCKR